MCRASAGSRRGLLALLAPALLCIALACHGHWRIALARYHRTREFRGQRQVPVYGTITVGRRF